MIDVNAALARHEEAELAAPPEPQTTGTPSTPADPTCGAESANGAESVSGAESANDADSKTKKFYHLSISERVEAVGCAANLSAERLAALGRPDALTLEVADEMIENVIGVMGLPLGIARNFCIDGREVLIPLAIEEPSVIAAASHGAKLLGLGGGITTSADESIMVGQVFLTGVHLFEDGAQRVAAIRDEIVSAANARHPRLVAAGGGVRRFELRSLSAREDGWIVVFELEVDVQDAMGANVVNSMCEGVAPLVAKALGGVVGMRILTNLCDRRLVRAEGRVPKEALGGVEGARAVADASLFAELCPYRACTHNKGIMNGVDAALTAFGQDWRAAEAGAHAFAGRGDGYKPLAVWTQNEDGDLIGKLELPLAVGTVGVRSRLHPVAATALDIVNVSGAQELARIAAAVGLAQNLAAIRALAHEGIIKGHMSLHNRVRS